MKVGELKTGDKFTFGGRQYIAEEFDYGGCLKECKYKVNDEWHHVYISRDVLVDPIPVMMSSLRRGDKFRFNCGDTVYEYLGIVKSTCIDNRVAYSISGYIDLIFNPDTLVIPAH